MNNRKLCTISFVVSSSGSRSHHLESRKEDYPDIVPLLEDLFYVDDLVTGAWDDLGAVEIYQKPNEVLKDGGFNLRKWASNSKVFQDREASDQQEVATGESAGVKLPKANYYETLGSEPKSPVCQKELDISEREIGPVDPNSNYTEGLSGDELFQFKQQDRETTHNCKMGSIKVLGVFWNVRSNEFEYDLSKLLVYAKALPATKWSVLKLSAKIFDPLGFISAFTIGIKILFQSLCIEKVNWDDPLSERALIAWNEIMKDLSNLKPFKIPRCYFAISNHPLMFELHGFSDAWCKAYAALVYLRTVYIYGGIDARLVASKTRVASIKEQSIPRQELLGGVILARLVNCVRNAMTSLPVVPRVFLWTDSFTVLCWIRNSKAWKSYAQNCVKEIRKLTSKEERKFCPGDKNPADLPSRGCRASEFFENETWWNGPHFLGLSEELWPNEPDQTENNDQPGKELMKSQPVITRALASINKQAFVNVEKVISIERYSTKGKLLRVTAYVKKFIDMAEDMAKGVRFTSVEIYGEEMREAEKLWIRARTRPLSYQVEVALMLAGEDTLIKLLASENSNKPNNTEGLEPAISDTPALEDQNYPEDERTVEMP